MDYKTIMHEDGTLEKVENGSKPKLSPQSPLSAAELAKLEEMDREGLISLIKRLPARITGYALQTKEEKREAMRLRVYEIAMSANNDAIVLKAANDWLDREEGKAMVRQMVDMRADITGTITHEARIKQADEEAERLIQIAMARRRKE